ncbi:twin-arginine translocation signal domain-containing protein, partial [Pseudomonas syringae pv. coryli]
MTDRRTFLKQAGLLAAALPLGSGLATAAMTPATQPASTDKWTRLKQLF